MADFPTIKAPSYPLVRMPMFDTSVITYGNKTEQRISRQASERYRFKIRYKQLSSSDMTTLKDFFIARKGAFEAFNWTDPEDSTVYLVRFEKDMLNLELFIYNLYKIKAVDLIQVIA